MTTTAIDIDNDVDDVQETEYAYIADDGSKHLPIGDAEHARLAVQAIATGLEGNKAQVPSEHMASVKAKISVAIHKFYSGDKATYYESWLHSGKKPDEPSSVKEISLSTPNFAFRGQFPNVPVSASVNETQLTEGDAKPLFVVRPLAVLNAVSDNGLKYDENLLREIERQVNTSARPARKGHVSEENSSWEFPDDVGLWVGAKRSGDTLWGKCYIYPGTPFHQMVVKRRAAGSTLSNSIWGKGHFETNGDGTQRLSGLELESIDFAPFERAALEALGGQFETTSEMKTGVQEMDGDMATEIAKTAPSALHGMMTPEQRKHVTECTVREMEPGLVYEMMPMDHKKSCAELYNKEFAPKESAAEFSGTSVAELTALKKAIAELQQRNSVSESQLAVYAQEKFDNTLTAAAAKRFASWNVNKPEGKAAIASATDNFKMYIVAQMAGMDGGQKLENIESAAEAAWPKYEPQAALLRTALSGGNVIAGNVSEQGHSNNLGWDAKTGRYTDEAARNARGVVAPH